jgi:hypothetical protein
MRDRFAVFSIVGKWRSPNLKPKPTYQSRVWGEVAIEIVLLSPLT